jgi:rRNA maturation RNase YbeY
VILITEGKTSSIKLRNKRKIYAWLHSVARQFSFEIDHFVVHLINDEELLQMNIKYLNHDTLTDILTFDYTENKVINAELYISTDRVIDNSKKFNTSIYNELHLVIIHGLLHCIGFRDKTKAEKEAMRNAENEALKMLNN